MPTALFIPEEHNCCYRYSYSGALQTPAALPQLIIQCSIRTTYLHTHTHTLLATFGPRRPPSKVLPVSMRAMSSRRQSWRAHLPHRAACQRALTQARYITARAFPPSRLQIIMHIIIWGVSRTWTITAGCLWHVHSVRGSKRKNKQTNFLHFYELNYDGQPQVQAFMFCCLKTLNQGWFNVAFLNAECWVNALYRHSNNAFVCFVVSCLFRAAGTCVWQVYVRYVYVDSFVFSCNNSVGICCFFYIAVNWIFLDFGHLRSSPWTHFTLFTPR